LCEPVERAPILLRRPLRRAYQALITPRSAPRFYALAWQLPCRAAPFYRVIRRHTRVVPPRGRARRVPIPPMPIC